MMNGIEMAPSAFQRKASPKFYMACVGLRLGWDEKMTAILSNFALIGRTYSSDAYQDLYQASQSARAERRVRRAAREADRLPSRLWHGSGEPVTTSFRLSA